MRLSLRLDELMSRLVVLDVSSSLETYTVFIDRDVFVVNRSSTMLLNFPLLPGEDSFETPVSFSTFEYEGRRLDVQKDGGVEFRTHTGYYVRRKQCRGASITPVKVRDLWESYRPPDRRDVSFDKDVLKLLDKKLSHVELIPYEGGLKLKQRDVYFGTVIEVAKIKGEVSGFLNASPVSAHLGSPVGLRTKDFFALFAFSRSLHLSFSSGRVDYCWVFGNSLSVPFSGLLSCCLYDGLGAINVLQRAKDGNEKARQNVRSDKARKAHPRRTTLRA